MKKNLILVIPINTLNLIWRKKKLVKRSKIIAQQPITRETKKSESFLGEKYEKITKQSRAYRGYASTYNVEILNSFNPKLPERYRIRN